MMIVTARRTSVDVGIGPAARRERDGGLSNNDPHRRHRKRSSSLSSSVAAARHQNTVKNSRHVLFFMFSLTLLLLLVSSAPAPAYVAAFTPMRTTAAVAGRPRRLATTTKRFRNQKFVVGLPMSSSSSLRRQLSAAAAANDDDTGSSTSSSTTGTVAPSNIGESTSTTTRSAETVIESSEADEPRVVVEFVNDGPLRWMEPYLDRMGIQEGKRLAYGPITVPVNDKDRPTQDESLFLKEQAAQQLMNINRQERDRRNVAGAVVSYLTVGYAFGAAVLWDDGGFGGHVLRLLTSIPLFLALGYKRSAQTGLCNIAQKGLWDVDGNGLQPIDDPTLATKILNRVNDMNLTTLGQAAIVGTIFAALPQPSSAVLATFVAFGAILYATRNVVDSLDSNNE